VTGVVADLLLLLLGGGGDFRDHHRDKQPQRRLLQQLVLLAVAALGLTAGWLRLSPSFPLLLLLVPLTKTTTQLPTKEEEEEEDPETAVGATSAAVGVRQTEKATLLLVQLPLRREEVGLAVPDCWWASAPSAPWSRGRRTGT
jgi:hypothetical protein